MFVSVKGKVVLIFGGSSGIGKALANRFCKEGAAVVATYFSTKTNEVAEMLEDNFRYCDIRHPSELNSVCEYPEHYIFGERHASEQPAAG